MTRKAKSQWDFGDLFANQKPAVENRRILSVSEITGQVRRVLEKHVGESWVTGEISNLKVQSSGHIYFTLKDASAQLSCVLFRGETVADRSLLQEGRMVILQGAITVYEARGQYQFRVSRVEAQGVGALQIAFEKLKQKLKQEGLFESERKRPIPRFPRRLGLVTSPSGAAIRDVLHVIQRRNPLAYIVLAPCRVQGTGSGAEVAASIRVLNEFSSRQIASGNKEQGLDAILITRGGGSLEDLWAFNEEVVARAIFESAIPVISAVGHEIDFTISDFVADLRAATPSAAAELLTEGFFSGCQYLSEAAGRMRQLVRQCLSNKVQRWVRTGRRLTRLHPRRRLDERLQRLDDLQTSLRRCARHGLRLHESAMRHLSFRLSRLRPSALLKQNKELHRRLHHRLHQAVRHELDSRTNKIVNLATRLHLLGPEQVLARGYSITTDGATGEILRDARGVVAGQLVKTRLHSGSFSSRVDPE